MTDRIRELLDEVVWSADDMISVSTETKIILARNLNVMLYASPTLNALKDWTRKQIKAHEDNVLKLSTSILRGTDCSSVKALRDHHRRICTRYSTVLLMLQSH
jgi:sugar-specific transcriptional regulator TrmB